MAKRNKQRPTRISDPLVIAAEETVSKHGRGHAEYIAQRGAERDADGSAENALDVVYMRRLACARGLESLVKGNAQRTEPFLQPYHLKAASAYQADHEASLGGASHELRPFVNRSSDVQGVSQKRIDAQKRIGKINTRMNPHMRVIVDSVVLHHPDKLMSDIYPKLGWRKMKAVKHKMRDGFHWLAIEYGFISDRHPLDEGGECA